MRRWHLIVWLVGLLLPSLTLALIFAIDLEEKASHLPLSDAKRAAIALEYWMLFASIPIGIVLCAVGLFASEGSAPAKFGLLIASVIGLVGVLAESTIILVIISFVTDGLSGMQ